MVKPTFFGFAATRTITGADFLVLHDFLRARGFDVEPFNEGIRWRGVEGRKDIFFSTRDQQAPIYELVGGYERNVGQWDFVIKQVFFTPCEPLWCVENAFHPFLYGDFSDDELRAIRADIVAAFGVVENVIKNEHRGILPSDTAADIRLFLYYDRDNAIKKWTKPNPRWPNIENERLFKCWKCSGFRPYFSFPLDTFDDLLEFYEFKRVPCCRKCQDELTYAKWTACMAKQLAQANNCESDV